MLMKLNSKLACHYDAIRNSFFLLWRRKFAAITTLFVIALTLTLPALFWVFTHNGLELTKDWKRTGHVTVYLAAQVENPESIVRNVSQLSGVEAAILKTPAEGMAELEQEEGMQNVILYLPDNPLPYVIEVTPKLTMSSQEQLKSLTQQLRELSGVEEAKLDLAWISRLYAWLDFAGLLVKGFIILLTLAVIFTIGNTLQLMIDHRVEHIQVLKLVGASDAYILRPFLYSGMWYGFLGAMIAIFLVKSMLYGITHAVNILSQLYQVPFHLQGLSWFEYFIFVVFSVFLGWLSANISVRKQLIFIEPSK